MLPAVITGFLLAFLDAWVLLSSKSTGSPQSSAH